MRAIQGALSRRNPLLNPFLGLTSPRLRPTSIGFELPQPHRVTGALREYPIELESGSAIRADLYYEVSNSIDESKVRGTITRQQLANYVEAIGMGKVKAGFYHIFLNPYNDEIGLKPMYAKKP